MKIVRQSAGVPAATIGRRAKVLECDVFHSTLADWKWLDRQTRKRARPWSRRARILQNILHQFCGKRLIHSVVSVADSVFSIFVDPKARTAVYWEERRRQRSGRTWVRCSAKG
jgi:hypothetical protein